MSVTCNRCGQSWPRDPALEVSCPVCPAAVGRKCRRPSGHNCETHSGRDQAALDAGLLQRCAGDTKTVSPPAGDLFAGVA